MAFANSAISDVIATTIQSRTGEIADNVTKNNAILVKMKAFPSAHRTLSRQRNTTSSRRPARSQCPALRCCRTRAKRKSST